MTTGGTELEINCTEVEQLHSADTTEISRAIDTLLQPTILLTREEVLSKATVLPKAPGIYAWYFAKVPEGIPTDDLHKLDDGYLLYAGISPKKPRREDGKPSSGTLRSRLRSHYRGNASQSTLRLSLGSLLHRELDINLQLSDSGRFTFGQGEQVLSDWMSENTRVCWVVDPEPWVVESAFIASVPLRLNLDQNKDSLFHLQLSQARADQRAAARS